MNTKETQDQKKTSRLGRGLDTLLPPTEADQISIQELPIEALAPNPYQPRQFFGEDSLGELEASIREHGIIQPLLVRETHISGQYEIIAGERRWRAAQRAQLHNVPVVVRSVEDENTASIALIENIQRTDLSPIEEAAGFSRLMEEFKKTQDSVAASVGKSRSYVANSLRLLSLPEDVQKKVEEGQLSAGHARALIGLETASEIAQKVIDKGLSVRKTEALVKSEKKPNLADHIQKGTSETGENQGSISSEAFGALSEDDLPPVPQNLAEQAESNSETENISEDLRDAVKNLSKLVSFENTEKDKNTNEIETRLSDLTGMDVYFTLDMSSDAGTLSFKYETLEQLDSLLIRFGIVQ